MISLTKKKNLALDVAKSFLSDETSLIHLSYQDRPFTRGDQIPLYHNFLYALILLQNKEKETMQKGMQLVEHLLCFQINEGEYQGAFPKYLHEYPNIERQFEVVDILLPLFRIYQDYSHLFQEIKREKLKEAIQSATAFLYKISNDKELSYLISLQIAVILKISGDLNHEKEWVEKGEEKLSMLLAKGPNKSWGSVRHLSKMILYFQLLNVEEIFGLDSFYQYLHSTWHPETKSYIGASINEHVYKGDQEPTIYHYYLNKAYSEDEYPLLDADVFETSLIKDEMPLKNDQLNSILNYSLNPFMVGSVQFQEFGYSFFNLDAKLWEKRGGFYPFRLIMKNQKKEAHSFALHMGSFCEIEKIADTKLLLTIENLPEKDLDVSFYGNHFSDIKIHSNNKKATMFDLSLPIFFKYDSFEVHMTFPKSTKNVCAQLCLGNRRSQMVDEFNKTYDWNLYFRKTSLTSLEPFKIELEIIKKESSL